MYLTKTIRLQLRLLWGLLLLLPAGTAFTQSLKVDGIVRNQRTAAPVPGATITLKDSANSYVQMYYNSNNRNSNQVFFGDVYIQVEPIKGLKCCSSIYDGFTDFTG